MPISTSRQPILGRTASEFDFLKSGHPSRAEVEMKLGKPDEYFPDLRVSAYPINTVIRRKAILFLGIIPVRFFRDYDAFDVAYIQFDEKDRAQRYGTTTQYGLYESALEFGAREWLGAAGSQKSDDRL